MCFQEAECEKTMMDTKYEADSRVADSNRGYQMMQAQFDQEVNAKVSDALLSNSIVLYLH